MSGEEAEKLLLSIDKAFGLTYHDFEEDEEGKLVPVYTMWKSNDNITNIEDLGDVSFKIGKDLGDIYINKIHTDGWLIIGSGTTLHCDDVKAGLGRVDNFEGFLL